MQIVPFTQEHLRPAIGIAEQEYKEEARRNSALPQSLLFTDISRLMENGLGVAALEKGELVGYILCEGPFKNAFRSTKATGVFSPLEGNGAVGERAAVYAALLQAAMERWALAGATSHALCLYAGDEEAQRQLFRYGFGLRCVDAIRRAVPSGASAVPGVILRELAPEEFARALPLHLALDDHMAASPCFMRRPSPSEEEFLESARKDEARYFIAEENGETVAFLMLSRGAETFVSWREDVANCTGAYCRPEQRGRGIMPYLLDYVLTLLESENYAHLGVDFESINPAADAFWRKHFSPYTQSLVRRIDENVLEDYACK